MLSKGWGIIAAAKGRILYGTETGLYEYDPSVGKSLCIDDVYDAEYCGFCTDEKWVYYSLNVKNQSDEFTDFSLHKRRVGDERDVPVRIFEKSGNRVRGYDDDRNEIPVNFILPCSIAVSEGWVYFTEADSMLYRIKTNNETEGESAASICGPLIEKTPLPSRFYLLVTDESIYTVERNYDIEQEKKQKKLCKMDKASLDAVTIGTYRERLDEPNSMYPEGFVQIDDKIYFINGAAKDDDRKGIYLVGKIYVLADEYTTEDELEVFE